MIATGTASTTGIDSGSEYWPDIKAASVTESGIQARQIIARRWPLLSRQMREASCNIDLRLDQTGRVDTLLANGLRLASAWDPEQEALLQCGDPLDGVADLTLFGVGLAYLPPLLLQLLPINSKLRIVPLNLALFNCMLDLVEMGCWLENPRVELQAAGRVKELPDHFRVTPAVLQLTERSAEPLRDWLLQSLSDKHMRKHQRKVERLLGSNIKGNLSMHGGDRDVAQCWSQRQRRSQAAVVVAAGPSLDYAYGAVRALQIAGAKVICVDAALASLLQKDILPDYIVSIDPLATIKNFFEVDMQRLAKSSLVYFPTVHPDVVKKWPHKRYVAVSCHPRFKTYSRKKATTVLFSSGSVIHPAVDLATRLAGTQIQLAGADFGYPFQSTHAAGVAVASDRRQQASNQLLVRNYRDQLIPSQMNMISYYRDLEQFIAAQLRHGLEFRNIGHFSARMRHVNVTPVSTRWKPMKSTDEQLQRCCDLLRKGHYAEASVDLEQWLAEWAEKVDTNSVLLQQRACLSLGVALDCQQRHDWIALADELQYVLSPLVGSKS